MEATDWKKIRCLQALNDPLQKSPTATRTEGQDRTKRKNLVQKTYGTGAMNAQ